MNLLQINPMTTSRDFEFRNFLPSPEIEASATATLEWLSRILPPDARISSWVRKVGPKYLCKVEVHTAIGFFAAEALEPGPLDAMDSAVWRVKASFQEWQEARLGLDGASYVELKTAHH